jgi:hypothetical protein
MNDCVVLVANDVDKNKIEREREREQTREF